MLAIKDVNVSCIATPRQPHFTIQIVAEAMLETNASNPVRWFLETIEEKPYTNITIIIRLKNITETIPCILPASSGKIPMRAKSKPVSTRRIDQDKCLQERFRRE